MSDYTILLIDYEPRSVESLTQPLTQMGYRVEVAMDGVEGVGAFQRLKPDMTFIEAMIPKKHGFDVCQELKSSDHGRRSPVVLMTAVYRGRKYREDAMNHYGCDEYLEKPISEKTLVAIVKKFLKGNPGKAAGSGAGAGRESEISTRLDSVMGAAGGGSTSSQTAAGGETTPQRAAGFDTLVSELSDEINAAFEEDADPAPATEPEQRPKGSTGPEDLVAVRKGLVAAAGPDPLEILDASISKKPAPTDTQETKAITADAEIDAKTATEPGIETVDPGAGKKRGVPKWVWGVGVLVLVLGGAGLVMMRGSDPRGAVEPDGPAATRNEAAPPRPTANARPEPIGRAATIPPSGDAGPGSPAGSLGNDEPIETKVEMPRDAGGATPLAKPAETGPVARREPAPEKAPAPVIAKPPVMEQPPAQEPVPEPSTRVQADPEPPSAEPVVEQPSTSEAAAEPVVTSNEPVSTKPAAEQPVIAEPAAADRLPAAPDPAAQDNDISQVPVENRSTTAPETAPETPAFWKGMLLDLDAVDTRPVPIDNTPPEYPARGTTPRQDGTVELEMLVDYTGDVIDVRVTGTHPDPVVTATATEAAQGWRFRPAVKNGLPVKVWLPATIRFER